MVPFLGFTLEQAATLSGLSPRQVRYWHDTAFFTPSYRDESGRAYGRVYSFRDVVGLRTLAILRQKHHVSLQSLRSVSEWFSANYEAPWSELSFYVMGRQVAFHDPKTGTFRSASHPEQTVIEVQLQKIARDTEADAVKLRERSPDEIGRIQRNRYIAHNASVIAGTRIRTEAVWNFHEAGYGESEILRQYPRLTHADVVAAISFERDRRQLAAS